MRVSLADVETLRQAEANLTSYMESLEACCAAEQRQMNEISDTIDEKQADFENELNEATNSVQVATAAYEYATEKYNQASANLSSARSRSSSHSKSENGNEESEDNDSEVEAAEEAFEEAAAELETATAALQEATERLNAIKEKLAAVHSWKEIYVQQQTDMQDRHTALRDARCTFEKGREMLQRKYAAMEGYLNEPAVKMAHSWLFSPPVSGSLVTPHQLNERLNPPAAVRLEVARYLRDTTPAFGQIIDNLAHRLHSAKTPQERWSAMRQIRATGTGTLAELVAQRGLECYARKTETQARTYFEGGQYTKTDLIMKDLKSPVILGKGSGMMAPAGGSIALEVKCGCKEYLMQQLPHMVFQAGGHQHCDASFTLTTRDIMQLSPEKQQQLRDALREAGSPIVGMLPEKAEMDATCMQLVEEREKALYGKDSNQAG